MEKGKLNKHVITCRPHEFHSLWLSRLLLFKPKRFRLLFLIFASVEARMLNSKSWRIMIGHFVIFPLLIFLVCIVVDRSTMNVLYLLTASLLFLCFFYLSPDFKRDMLALIDEKMDI